ncbi:MAG TPA: site-specific integrase [Candidatus Sulfotelmatobacter sp.]|nr:site-specific integrase [Candidatus Sulfotelmatobacter sp.]
MHGIAVKETAPDVSLPDACAEFLEETRQQRTIKTVAQYTTALDYFQASCPSMSLHAIDRQHLMRFMVFLAEQKHRAPRTIWTKVAIVVQMLKANGITKLLKHRDWPRFVEKVPQAYTAEELRRFFAACDRRERVLFEFFLGTGFREKEVQYATWKDVDFEENTARMTAKTRSGFVPKTSEEREVLIPDHLVESLRCHKAAANPDCPWIFPSANGCVSYHFLSDCKRIAWRAKLNCGTCHTKQGHCHRGPHCANWFLHKFRATYATNQLRVGTDIRTLQVWMGHKDLASTMRYLKAGYGKDMLARVNQAFAIVTGIEAQTSQEGLPIQPACHRLRIKAERVAHPKRRNECFRCSLWNMAQIAIVVHNAPIGSSISSARRTPLINCVRVATYGHCRCGWGTRIWHQRCVI